MPVFFGISCKWGLCRIMFGERIGFSRPSLTMHDSLSLQRPKFQRALSLHFILHVIHERRAALERAQRLCELPLVQKAAEYLHSGMVFISSDAF